jgi:endogenous inhibitor of DNA gyrase (YacG/DUF329 family)
MADDKRDRKTESNASAGAASNVAPFAATGRGKPCPICGRPSAVEVRPFCSKRCADIDLSRWLGEVYRVPSSEPASSDDESALPQGSPKTP